MRHPKEEKEGFLDKNAIEINVWDIPRKGKRDFLIETPQKLMYEISQEKERGISDGNATEKKPVMRLSLTDDS